MKGLTFVCVLLDVLLLGKSLLAQPQLELEPFATGIQAPVSIAHADDERLFVVSKQGRIYILDTLGQLQPEPFLDISDRVWPWGGEQGLLGLAFDPDHKTNGHFYVNYIASDQGTRVARFTLASQGENWDPHRADPASQQILLSIDQPYNNHNGGDLAFGPDGYLYIALGDGGSAGDPLDAGQDPLHLLGKILRLDVSGETAYRIPEDNPFLNDPATRDEIWALGLRNPWRMSFDRETGDLWIGDVGQDEYEEISREPAGSPGGLNYGWRCYEGNDAFRLAGCAAPGTFHFPVHTYENSFQVGRSVTGGYVYRGVAFPTLQGHYVFGDYESGRVWTLFQDEAQAWQLTQQGQLLAEKQISTFGEDASGELYVAAYAQGAIYRISERCTAFQPEISQQGDTLQATEGETYQWFVDGEAISGAVQAYWVPNTPGTYTVEVGQANGCRLLSDAYIFQTTNLVPAKEERVKVFPNPASGQVRIQRTGDRSGPWEVRLLDLQGRLVHRQIAYQAEVVLSLDQVAAGAYFVWVEGAKTHREKLLVVKP